jgi:hypothetical protein
VRQGLIEMGEIKWHRWVHDIMKDKESRTAKQIQVIIMDRGYRLTPSATRIAAYLSRNDKYISHGNVQPYLWKMIE